MKNIYSKCHGCKRTVSYGDRHVCRMTTHRIAASRVVAR